MARGEDTRGEDTFDRVIAEYRRMEPDGTDTWNPLVRDRELYHRMILVHHLCSALRQWPGEIDRLRVLDVGCGNGRSTRMYLDFGLAPAQILGVDLRPGALAMARAAHPGIAYLLAGDTLPLQDEAVDWVSLCTVISSLGAGARARLARETYRVLAPGGMLFFFDRPTAHVFAGGDALGAELFAPLRLIRREPVRQKGWPATEESPLPPLQAFLLHKEG